MYKTDHRLTDVPDDTVIWRYMDFLSFYSLLESKSIFFKRLDKYTDGFEGTLPEKTKEALYQYRLGFDYTSEDEAKDWINTELKNIDAYKAWTLSNSWSMGATENYAMWKIYLGGKNEGVAIKSTVGKLKQCLEQNKDFLFYSGKVNYTALNDKDIDVFRVSTNKREPYIYENEYRALILHQFTPAENKQRSPKFEVGANIKLDLSELIDEIYVSPFSNDWFHSILLSVLKIHFNGFPSNRIHKSYIKDT